MAKHLNVNLQFTADTSQAKAQIQSLQQSLASLSTANIAGKGMTGYTTEVSKAIGKVNELKSILASATTSAGTLDLGKFNASMKKAGTTINDYKKHLMQLGPAGKQAFAQLAQSVSTASVPIKQTSGLLNEMATTLKNTARWQLTSSIIHGFMSSLQSAMSYAKGLDKSLTDIRIVSGMSADEMERFAVQANKSAQALSTSTKTYADAALIYYQQGLSESEVKERTDVTVKMANVTGEAAADVSSYMTAIWNNFNKEGQYAEEHFADIMTRLGAETAASTDEIAAGLSKFSAIADTVGLSFDMASSAVTAVIDQTREAPEVVGTAMKTIFSRVEGLKMGETLEDGVDLNKYSTGLAKVGVDIFDATGNLKDMDDILHEIGDTWEDLSREEQIALSQTVAGVRQYNQFMAIFDNWDHVEENLEMAAEAGGTLQEQADIYAESWEGARNRVKAAMEDIWNKVIDDDFFIELNNGLADFIGLISRTIDSLGGMKGVLLLISTALMNAFGKSMSASIDRFAYNIHLKSKQGQAELATLRTQTAAALKSIASDGSISGGALANSFVKTAGVQEQIIAKSKEITARGREISTEEQNFFNAILQSNEALSQQYIQMEKIREAAKNQANDAALTGRQKLVGAGASKVEQGQYNKNVKALEQNYTEQAIMKDLMNKSIAQRNTLGANASATDVAASQASSKQFLQEYIQTIEELKKSENGAMQVSDRFINKLKEIANMDASKIDSEIDELIADLGALDQKSDAIEANLRSMFENAGYEGKELDAIIDNIVASMQGLGKSAPGAVNSFMGMKKGAEDAEAAIKRMNATPVSIGQKVTAAANALSALGMAISSIQGMWDTLNNPDATGWEKLTSVLMTLGMVVPMVTQAFSIQNLEMIASIGTKGAVAAADTAVAVAETEVGVAAGGAAPAVGGLAAAEGAAGTAGVAGAAGVTTFGAALKAALPPLLAISLGITALILLIKAIKETVQGNQIALDKAKKSATDTKNVYEGLKTEAEDMSDAFDKIREQKTIFEDLTEGSKEWNEALKNNNNTILELLDKYPELAKYIYRDQDGKLTIDESDMGAVEAAKQDEVIAAHNASISANVRAEEQQIVYDRSELMDDIGINSANLDVNEIGTEVFDKVIELAMDYGAAGLKDEDLIKQYLGEDVDVDILQGIQDNVAPILRFLENKEAHDQSIQIQNSAIAQGILDNTAGFDDAFKEGGKFYGVDKGLVYDEVADRADSDSEYYKEAETKYNGMTKDEIIDAYDDVYGTTSDKSTKNFFQGREDDVITVGLEGGGTQELTVEDMANALVSKEAFEAASGDWESIARSIKHIENSDFSGDYAGVYNSVASGKDGDPDSFDYSSLGPDTKKNAIYDEIKGMSADDLADYIGVDDDYAISKGFKNAQDYAKAYRDGLQQEVEKTTSFMDLVENSKNNKGEVKNKYKAGNFGDPQGSRYEKNAEKILQESDSVADLNVAKNNDLLNTEDYQEGLVNLAASYADLEDETNALTEAQENQAEVQEKNAKILKTGNKHSKAYKKALKEQEKAAQETTEAQVELEHALIAKEWQKGLKNVKKYTKELEEGKEGSEEYKQACEEIAYQLEDLTGLEVDADWVKEHKQEILDWQNGVDGAASRLQSLISISNASTAELKNLGVTTEQLKNFIQEDVSFDVNGNANFGPLLAEFGIVESELQTVGAETERLAGILATLGTSSVELKKDNGEILTLDFPDLENMSGEEATAALNQFQADLAAAMSKGFSLSSYNVPASAPPAPAKDYSGRSPRGSSRPSGTRRTERRREKRYIAKKDKSDEIERYHVVNNELEDMEHKLNMIEKAKDRAFGKDKLAKMDEEAEALKKNIELQRKYQRQIKTNLKNDRKKLAGDGTKKNPGLIKEKLGMDVKFDENGTITNWKSIKETNLQKFEDGRLKYKHMTAKKQEELDKKYQEKFNPETGQKYSGYEEYLEAEYEKINKALDQYEETQDLAKDVQEQIQDSLNELYDLKLEKLQYKLELDLQITEDDQKILDFLMDRMDGDAWRAAEQVAVHHQTIQNSQANIQSHEDTIRGIFANHEGVDADAVMEALLSGDEKTAMDLLQGVHLTEDEVEQLRESMGAVLDETSNIKDAQMAVVDSVGEVNDAHMEAFDNISSSISNTTDYLLAYGEIIDLIGQKQLGISEKQMRDMEDQAMTLADHAAANAKKKSDQAKIEHDAAILQLQAAEATGDKELISHWKTVVQQTRENMESAKNEWIEAWTAQLEQAQQIFDERIRRSTENFANAMAGNAGTADGLSATLERRAMVDDNYLQDYERIYEMNKLAREIGKSIDETSNIKAKRELLELEEKIVQQKESGNDMSEYEVQQLRKQYELKLAEIALEESRNAKSQVRMTKDAEGNFSYVYTADEDAVEDAEQNYEDKLKEYQELNYNYIKDLESQMAELGPKMAQEINAAAEVYGRGTEAYYAAVNDIQAKYGQEYIFLSEQMNKVLSDNKRLHEEDVTTYAETINSREMLNMDYIEDFSQLPISLATGFKDMTTYTQTWEKETNILFEQAAKDAQNYETAVSSVMDQNTKASQSFSEALDESLSSVASTNEAYGTEITSVVNQITTSWEETIAAVSKFATTYNQILSDLSTKNKEFADTITTVLDMWRTIEEESTTAGDPSGGGDPPSNPSGGGDPPRGGGSKDDGKVRRGEKVTLKRRGKLSTTSYKSPTLTPLRKYRGAELYVQMINPGTKSPYHLGTRKTYSRSSAVGWVNKKQITGFDTGGYTGKWADGSGKLAMLHQKEIVLNAGDTENFLKTVDIVRQISQTIDLNALSTSGGLSSGLHMVKPGMGQNDVLEQNVHITAEFPNATDKNEIIKAFDNVINLAAQYSHQRDRKK